MAQRPAGLGDLNSIAGAILQALRRAGYEVRDESESTELRTFRVAARPHRPGGRPVAPVKVQIGRDYQLLASVRSVVGPTLDPLELAANKILTVYDRPRARDADDLARLIPYFGLTAILDVADRKQVTPLDRDELAEAFRLLIRVSDDEFPDVSSARAVKAFMAHVADAVKSGREPAWPGPYG